MLLRLVCRWPLPHDKQHTLTNLTYDFWQRRLNLEKTFPSLLFLKSSCMFHLTKRKHQAVLRGRELTWSFLNREQQLTIVVSYILVLWNKKASTPSLRLWELFYLQNITTYKSYENDSLYKFETWRSVTKDCWTCWLKSSGMTRCN